MAETDASPARDPRAFQYKAFISYSHADEDAVRWLHRRLETYKTPKQFHGAEGLWGPVPERLTPVFRDRDELSSSGVLGAALEGALENSQFLIVVCSPAAARSRWVNEEIRAFRKTHSPAQVMPVIVDGDPAAPVGENEIGCFPPALTEPETQGGAPVEPIAADMRPEGDGRRAAFLKLASGLLGLRFDDLVQREAHRRQRNLTLIAASTSIGMIAAVAVSLFALNQRAEANRQREIAEHQYETATAALDYLVGIFEIANPATENPKTITALTILERGQTKLDERFAENPDVKAKLLGAIGSVYANLGELEKAEQTLREAIEEDSGTAEDRIANKLALASILIKKFELDDAGPLIDDLEAELQTAEQSKSLDPSDIAFFRGLLISRQADYAWTENNLPRAIELYAEARKALAQTTRDTREQIAQISSTRGMLLASEKRIEESSADLEQSRNIFLDLYGEDHLKTAVATHNIAYMFFEAGMNDDAIEYMTQSVSTFEKVLEPNHPNLSSAQLLMGRTLQANGDHQEAVKYLTQSVETAKLAFGPMHEKVGFGLLYLALAQADAGETLNALTSLDAAETIYEANFPPGDFNHGDLMVYRAIVHGKAGRKDQARQFCDDGLKILTSTLGPEHNYLAEMADNCAAATG